MRLSDPQPHLTEYLGQSSVKYYFLDQIYKILFCSDMDNYALSPPCFLLFRVYTLSIFPVEFAVSVLAPNPVTKPF